MRPAAYTTSDSPTAATDGGRGVARDDLHPADSPACLEHVEQVALVAPAEHEADGAPPLAQALAQGEQRRGGVPLAHQQAADLLPRR